jgi:Fur family peroxide stress response transcriptional regulator
MKLSLSEIVEDLRRKGYRLTPQRQAIVQALLDAEGTHPSAQEIYERVSPQFPMITLATIYNTLQVLEDMGVVTPLGFPGASTRYETAEGPHINLLCLRCGRIDDLPLDDLPELQQKVAADSGYLIRGAHLEYRGYCPTCRVEVENEQS